MALFAAFIFCIGFLWSVFFVRGLRSWIGDSLWGGYLYLLQNDGQVSEQRVRWAAIPRSGWYGFQTEALFDERGRLTRCARFIWTAFESKFGNGPVYSFAWTSTDSSYAQVDVHNGYFFLCRKRIGCSRAKAVIFGDDDSLVGL